MYSLLLLALRSILSSIIGSSFYKWFQSTKFGIWFQLKLDNFMIYLSDKYDIELMKKEVKWRAHYPYLANKIDSLEDEIDEIYKKINSNEKSK